jgi:hypothetical protein
MSIDKRLTTAEKKKIKPVNQGGGPNYLGKQETVTVPKKWLSDPDHVVAELAYITPREQKILLDANIYGSLKGKPNKGPGGIMSLQGDLGGYDASPGGPNDGGSKGTSTESKSKQRAADIMTGKVSVSSPTGVTEGYKGPAPTGQNKFGDFVGPGYKGKVGGFDDKGIFSTSFAPTTPKGFNFKNALFNIALTAINPALAAKYGKVKSVYNAAKFAGKLATDIGLTDKNVVDSFTSNFSDKFSGFGKGTSKGTTSTNNTTNNGGKGEGDGIASLDNQASGYDEYILLLQKLQSGNISDAERNRYNVLKNMLGI